MDNLDRAKLLMSLGRTEGSAGTVANVSQTTTITGRATSDSVNGYVFVDMGGDTLSQDGKQSIEMPTTVIVYDGDMVRISLVGADGTAKTPTVTGVIGGGDRTQSVIDKVVKDVSADVDNINSEVAQINADITAVNKSIADFKADASSTYATKKERKDGDDAISLTLTTDYYNKKYVDTTLVTTTALSQTKDAIEADVSSSYATKTTVDGVNSTATTALANANKAQSDLTAYESSVSETYATKAALKETSDSITASVSDNYTKSTNYTDGKISDEVSARDAAISVSANKITSTVSETYATQSALSTVSSAASAAQTKADGATAAASTAQTSADGAQATANSAMAEASTAQSTADSVASNLSTNYSTTAQMQSAITQSANSITSTVSATYATQSSLSSVSDAAAAAQTAASAAQTAADNAQTSASSAQSTADGATTAAGKAQTTADSTAKNLADNYSTTAQMNSAISQSAENITSTVSATYATQESLSAVSSAASAAGAAASAAQSTADTAKTTASSASTAATNAQASADSAQTAANSAQDSATTTANNLANNYSTTVQMNSAISQSASNITSTVSETYATKTALGAVDTRVATTESKLTSSALTTTISTGLASSDALSTTKFVMDANGLLIKNGGLSIKNNDGTTVMAADTNGDLSLTSKIYATGGEFKGPVRVRSGTSYGSIIIDGTRVNNAYTYNGTAYDRQAFVEYTGAEMIFKLASTAHNGATTPITATPEEFGRIVTNISENWAGPGTSNSTIRNGIEILLKNYGRFVVSDNVGGKMLEVNNKSVWAKNFVNGSSERLKKNIEPAGLKAAYDALKSSKVYQYNYKTEDDDAATVHRGFVVERECPEMFLSEDGQGVDLYSIVSTTWQLLQDMSARIDALEGNKRRQE